MKSFSSFRFSAFVLWLWCFLPFSMLQAEERLSEFEIAGCVISNHLNPAQNDSSVFLSFKMLEKVVIEKLKENNEVKFEERDGKPLVYFEENGSLNIYGTVTLPGNKVLPMHVIIKPGFFKIVKKRYAGDAEKQEYENTVHFDFSLSIDRTGLGSRILSFLIAPVSMIVQTVVSVVFAASTQRINLEGFANVDIGGKFDPLAFLKSLGISLVNLFLPSNKALKNWHYGTVKIELLDGTKAILGKMSRVEIGTNGKGIIIYTN
jgi:hypothetical protein